MQINLAECCNNTGKDSCVIGKRGWDDQVEEKILMALLFE